MLKCLSYMGLAAIFFLLRDLKLSHNKIGSSNGYSLNQPIGC